MDRYRFRNLVNMLETTGQLRAIRNLTVNEQVAMFLYILAHRQKNRTMKTNFLWLGEIISRYFNKVLNAVLRIQDHLLKAPSTVREDSTDEKWKWFKNCIGALDDTYIKVKVFETDKPSWECSAADSRILRNALGRRNGLLIQDDVICLFGTHIMAAISSLTNPILDRISCVLMDGIIKLPSHVPPTTKSRGEGTSKNPERKRRSADSLILSSERMTDALTSNVDKCNEEMSKFVKRIAVGVDQKKENNRHKLNEELQKIEYLTDGER
ncbi:hypothetical protein C2S51_015460 [Perilla frutescens var. frutescens]|nr:hypothetical protein C2S51_015460 [Perilla frutescens var. frutescens]